MKDWHLVERAFLDAALGRADWDAAMDVVSQVTGSVGAVLFPVGGHLISIPKSQSMNRQAEAYFAGGWHLRDERWAGLSQMKSKGITTEFDFTTPDLMRKSAFYEEFLRPMGLRWFAGLVIQSGPELWTLSLQHSVEQGPFQQPELQALRAVSDSLNAAADITRAIATARIGSAARAFELSQTPAVFLDRTAAVILSNDAADALYRQGDIRLSHGRLAVRSATESARLDRAIAEVLTTRDRASSRAVPISRPQGRGLVARVVRFEEPDDQPLALCQAVVLFYDLDLSRNPLREKWHDLFGLTAAECRLVEALLQGLSLEEAAAEMALSRETLRSRIKEIFAKTGVSRQGELIALFARLQA